jgi:PAS domain S-box-containing protein
VLVRWRSTAGERRAVSVSEEFRKLHEKSKQMEEVYRSLLNSAPDAIAIYDIDGRLKYANDSFTRVFGWTFEELEGSRIPYVPDCELEVTRQIRDLAIQHGAPHQGFETKRYAKDRRLIDVSLSGSLFRDHEGNPAGWLVIFRDITERKLAELALRESEGRFRAIFESARDCIFIKDRSLRYTLVNPVVESFFGVPASKIIGKTAQELLDKQKADYVESLECRALEGEIVEDEHSMTVNGRMITLLVTRVPLCNPEGEVIGLCGIARDVTDRRMALSPALSGDYKYSSKAMRSTLAAASLAAKTDATVLLIGESGSGKDYIAQYIHDQSNRAGGSFFSVNCAAIPSELAESELFGHEAGAFTGARARKRGLLELAEGGTLLLNEVGELPLQVQAKLLTFLDTRSFTRVGGEKKVTVSARLISATNRDLENEISQSRFRQDLFYRLNVLTIKIPPLRERIEDIPVLVDQLISKLALKLHLAATPYVDSATTELFSRYSWPGNVRELRNVLERALILSGGGELSFDLPESSGRDVAAPSEFMTVPPGRSMNDFFEDLKLRFVQEALGRSAGNKQKAARLLGISRYALKRLMNRLGLLES